MQSLKLVEMIVACQSAALPATRRICQPHQNAQKTERVRPQNLKKQIQKT